jgi:predicted nuclease of restriction endonuclease-like RecB superfamily
LSIPLEHIRVFRRKGVIKPIFLREPLGILNTLIEVFKDHKDEKRGQLNEVLSDCEHLGYDYKMVRGIASVLEARSTFQSRSRIPPLEARRQVFTEAATNVVASKAERIRVLRIIAEKKNLSIEELDDSLYADLDDEQYLIGFREPSAEELMKQYNYGNMVALLAFSLNLDVTYRDKDEYLENIIKRLGKTIIYESNLQKASIELKPTKRLNQRADRINQIISRIISKKDWNLRANIKYPARYKTTCIFEINSREDGKLLEFDTYEAEVIIDIGTVSRKSVKYGDIVVLEELARRHGVTSAQILKYIKKEDTNYKDLGGILVSIDKHEEVEAHLKTLRTLGEAQSYFKNLGVRDFITVLESYGYQVEWSRPHRNSKIYRL